jgi:rubrerythrin
MNEKTKKLSTPREILEAALAKEEEAYNLYDNLLKEAKITILRETLAQLKDEEYKHIKLIKGKLLTKNVGL